MVILDCYHTPMQRSRLDKEIYYGNVTWEHLETWYTLCSEQQGTITGFGSMTFSNFSLQYYFSEGGKKKKETQN